jgi:hypothetical protein
VRWGAVAVGTRGGICTHSRLALRALCRHGFGRNARQSPTRDTAQDEMLPRHAGDDNGQRWRRSTPRATSRQRRDEHLTRLEMGGAATPWRSGRCCLVSLPAKKETLDGARLYERPLYSMALALCPSRPARRGADLPRRPSISGQSDDQPTKCAGRASRGTVQDRIGHDSTYLVLYLRSPSQAAFCLPTRAFRGMGRPFFRNGGGTED